ncbi:MAG: DMT family transporter [Deltaproteobacteria bacterium]|jgi:drug/metabolite transporter (DMT)-like permease|nr:DMT family transporter [Deltaproteobacteria bacterium]
MAAGLGELAALGTALTWGVSSQVQSAVGRMVGATGVTLLRMPYQMFFLAAMCLALQADTRLNLGGVIFLGVSGFLGIFLCDFCLYRAFNIIGPSTAVLILSTSTAYTPLFGWLFLGEALPLLAVAGIAVTLAGIFIVVTEHSGSTLLPGQAVPRGRELALGILLSAVAALTLSLSFILLKKGLQTDIDPLWATFVRLVIGALLLWGAGLLRGWSRQAVAVLRHNRKVHWLLFFSCAFGAGGMWFASLAVSLAPVGVASTLIALQPVSVTVLGALWYRRRPTLRILTGIAVAFGGTALICLR